MRGVGFRRLFWIGAAGLLGLAALISIVALLRGEFSETDGKILGTLGAAFLAGSAALAGLALVDRRDLPLLGGLVAGAAAVAFGLLTWQLWADFEHDRLALDALLVAVAALMLATARLLLRDGRFAWLFWTSTALTAATTVVYLWAIHTEPQGDGWAKALGTLGIVTALAWFLVPVLGRTSQTAAPERVVGRGPGRVEVDLAEGEILVVRR